MFFFFSLEFFLSKIIRNIILTVEYYYAYSVGWYQIIKEERKEERGDFKKKKKRRRRRRRRAFTTRSSLFHTTKVFVIKRYIQLVGVVGKRLDYAINFYGAQTRSGRRLFNRTSQSPCLPLLLRPGQPRQPPARRHRHRHRHRRHRHRSFGTRSGWPNSL